MRAYHDFYAPIDGFSHRFTLRADSGKPVWIQAAEPIPGRLGEKLFAQLDLLNLLLRDVPWAMLAMQRTGNLGAIIEAAEARRAEIYGDAAVAA